MSQITFWALMSGVGVAGVLLLVAVFLTLREIADAATEIQVRLEAEEWRNEWIAAGHPAGSDRASQARGGNPAGHA